MTYKFPPGSAEKLGIPEGHYELEARRECHVYVVERVTTWFARKGEAGEHVIEPEKYAPSVDETTLLAMPCKLEHMAAIIRIVSGPSAPTNKARK